MRLAAGITQEMVLTKVIEILADLLCIQVEDIKPESYLEADLGFGVVEGVRPTMGQIDGFVLQLELEQEFEIKFEDDYCLRLPGANVQEIANEVISRMSSP